MNWKDDLKRFESDNSTGSAELLEGYIELLLYWLEKGELQTPKDKSFLMDQIKRLQDRHKSLFVFLHFSYRVIQLLNSNGEDWNHMVVDFLNEYRAYQGNRKKVKIIQTESRPILEGRIQAVNLHKLGYEVKLVSDTGYARHLDRINMILLGADAIFRDYFVNKSGSYNICMAGKNAGIPVYILADSRKFWFSLAPEHQEMQYNESKKPGEEIWKDPHPGIDIENFYFEKIPVDWADGFITEKEILKPSLLQKLSEIR
jgi:hypothetical protein